MPTTKPVNPARIRSFIYRQGRITLGQKLALDKLWDNYCLDANSSYDYKQVFARDAPLLLEIGFGNGACLAAMAEAHPELNFIGIEVHKPGVGHLMLELQRRKLTNVKIFCYDAVDILNQTISDNSLSAVHLFFPDPWHKRKHHKRRIVNTDFVATVAVKLKPDGYFHAATDWEDYALQMLKTLRQNNLLNNAGGTDGYSQRPDYRPITKFENRGLRLGHDIRDIIFKKTVT